MTQKPLCTQNAKTPKGEAKGYLTGILYLASHKSSGKNVCPNATDACIFLCLDKAGRGQFLSTIKSRIKKTRWLLKNRKNFLEALVKDIQALIRKANRENKIPTVRLNGTSDLDWRMFRLNGKNIFEIFPEVQFYDYTKNPNLFNKTPPNLHLTFSYSVDNKAMCEYMLSKGVNVAVAIRDMELKKRLLEDKDFFIDGDEDDLRFLDGKLGKVVLLKAKGKARRDERGFVIDLPVTPVLISPRNPCSL